MHKHHMRTHNSHSLLATYTNTLHTIMQVLSVYLCCKHSQLPRTPAVHLATTTPHPSPRVGVGGMVVGYSPTSKLTKNKDRFGRGGRVWEGFFRAPRN